MSSYYMDINEIAARWKLIQGEAKEVLRLTGYPPEDEGFWGESLWARADVMAARKAADKNKQAKKIFARRPRVRKKKGAVIWEGMHTPDRPKAAVEMLIRSMYQDGMSPSAIMVRVDYPKTFVDNALKSLGYDPQAEPGQVGMIENTIPNVVSIGQAAERGLKGGY